MPNVLVTTAFGAAQIERLRRVSPRLTVTRADPETADYSSAEILSSGKDRYRRVSGYGRGRSCAAAWRRFCCYLEIHPPPLVRLNP